MVHEIVMKDRIYITGQVKDVLVYLRHYQHSFVTLQDLINSKMDSLSS